MRVKTRGARAVHLPIDKLFYFPINSPNPLLKYINDMGCCPKLDSMKDALHGETDKQMDKLGSSLHRSAGA